MEHIYPTKEYKVYNVKKETEKLSNSVLSGRMPQNLNDITKIENISTEKLKEITLDLCKTYEDYGNDLPSNTEQPFTAFPQEALQLNFVKTVSEGNFTFIEPRVKDTTKTKKRENDFADLEIYKDSILTIRFYEPFKYSPCTKNQPRFHQEYLVLGSNFLTDLRDKFYCQCNFGPFFDISDNPNVVTLPGPDETNPGFFFIHDTFYNDTRNPSNANYSETILKWFKKFHYVRNFKSEVMEGKKFQDLNIRLGYPCVYQHHGACEHIFCITSVDLLDSSDNLKRSAYPIISKLSRKRSKLCDICGQMDANYLVTNCALHVKDPMNLCSGCFFSFHYEKDGMTKIGSFNAYRIFSANP